jgi:putative ABC transport system permease protein
MGNGIIFRFLKWICPAHLFEEIEGDLIQRFNRDSSRYGIRTAKRLLYWNALRFLRPGIILRNKFSMELTQLYMLRTNLVLACRSMIRTKVFSFINILGLSLSMTVCLLIFYFVRFELSYDDFHTHAHNIYRVATKVTLQNEVINHETNTYVGIRRALLDKFPEVKASTSIGSFGSDNTFIWYEDKTGNLAPIQSYKAFGVDSSFLEVFSFPLLNGDERTVLREPYSAIISQSFADLYFDGNAIGKVLETYDGVDRDHFTIRGILKDVPANSHFKFDLVTRGASGTRNFLNRDAEFWDWGGQTYVLMDDEADVATFEQKLDKLAVSKNGLKTNKDDYGQVSTFDLQRLNDIHLHSNLLYELDENGSGLLVYAMIILAVVVIIIAWINYVNLSTAITEKKSKSIGVRKIIGASRLGLIFQFLTESVLFNFISIVAAVALAVLLLPSFSAFAGIPLDYTMLYNKWVCAALLVFMIMSAIMSGVYPSMLISSFSSVNALKGRSGSGSSFGLRKVLVVFQFTAAVGLMIAALVAFNQLTFMRSRELGITIDKVLVLKAMNFDKETWSDAHGGFVVDSAYQIKADAFMNALRLKPGIVNITSASHLPGEVPSWGTEFKAKANDAEKAFRLLAVGIDYDFINTLDVRLLAGRNFSPDFPSDRGNEGRRAVLLNEAASKLLGFKTPASAVGRHISTYWGADYEIIGVLNSFHQLSLRDNLAPMYFILQPRALSYYAVKFSGENTAHVIEDIKASWERYFPESPFNYFFLDEHFNRQYQYEQKFTGLLSLFTGLAVVIACLGLFGLTAYAIVQRTKEVGIRKVLGATISSVIGLFTNDFVKLILIANVVAIPFTYIGVSRWLEGYAFRIALQWWMFVTPACIVLIVALVTVSLQTVKVAMKNPVDSLKYE